MANVNTLTDPALRLESQAVRVDDLTLFGPYEGPGFMVAGLWPTLDSVPPPPQILDLWPVDTAGEPYMHHGPGWIAHLWDLRIGTWPTGDRWLTSVESTLGRIRQAGALIAWMATDTTFADPPMLFTADVMGRDVFAVLSPATGFVCTAAADGRLEWLPSETQQLLRDYARSIVDLSRPDLADPAERVQ